MSLFDMKVPFTVIYRWQTEAELFAYGNHATIRVVSDGCASCFLQYTQVYWRNM